MDDANLFLTATAFWLEGRIAVKLATNVRQTMLRLLALTSSLDTAVTVLDGESRCQ